MRGEVTGRLGNSPHRRDVACNVSPGGASNYEFCDTAGRDVASYVSTKAGIQGAQWSAGQLVACDFQAGQISKGREGDRFRLEEFVGQGGQVVGGYGFDSLDQFVEVVEAVEIHFLARQVRHASGARFERQHQASFELGFRATEFFVRHGFRLELSEFADYRLHDLRGGRQRCAGVNGETSCIAVRIQIAVNRIGQN